MPWFFGNKAGRTKAIDSGTMATATDSLDAMLQVHQSALLEIDENKFTCRVHDFTADIITLTAPLDDNGHAIRIPGGTSVRVVLQADQNFYGFNARVAGPKMVNNLPLLDIKRPTAVERTDRREYYRVPVDFPFEYRLSGHESYSTGRVADLSGGGFLCLVPRNLDLKQGLELDVRFSLPTTHQLIEARVNVRKLFDPLPRADNRRVACEFVELHNRMREWVIRYVVQRQLELIRAGVLH